MKRPVWLTVNLSVEEKARIAAAAGRDRRTLSAWARLVLLDNAPSEKVK